MGTFLRDKSDTRYLVHTFGRKSKSYNLSPTSGLSVLMFNIYIQSLFVL